MASAEIEPDLTKPPPHLEGQLLRQNPSSFVGKKGWKNYFFVVRKDKLLYFKRKDDYVSQRDPISVIFLSRITDVIECVHSDVPKKHHLNCGFQIITHDAVYNLLTETVKETRHWVSTLRYIKEYCSRLEVRYTVISAEQEMEFVKRALEDDADSTGAVFGEFNDSEVDSSSTKGEQYSRLVTVTFSDMAKTSVRIPVTAHGADLLGAVKGHLTSSASVLWVVNKKGQDYILKHESELAPFLDEDACFYALGPSYVILVVMFKNNAFEQLVAPNVITAQKVVNHPSIVLQRDKMGIGSPGLFYQDGEGVETMFRPSECPTDVLFEAAMEYGQQRRPGKLMIKNKTLGGIDASHIASSYRRRTLRVQAEKLKAHTGGGTSKTQGSAEEDAQQAVLEKLAARRSGKKPPNEDIVNTGTPDDDSSDLDGHGDRMHQRKLQRSPKVVRARPQHCDDDQSFNTSLDNSGPKLQNSRKRSADQRGKLSSTRKTNKNGKLSVASGAAEAAGSPDYDSKNSTEEMVDSPINSELFHGSDLHEITPALFNEGNEEDRLDTLFEVGEGNLPTLVLNEAESVVLSLARKCLRCHMNVEWDSPKNLAPISIAPEDMCQAPTPLLPPEEDGSVPIPVHGIGYLKQLLNALSLDSANGQTERQRAKVLSLSGKLLCVNDVWELAEGCHFDRDIDVVQAHNSVFSEEVVVPGGIRVLFDYSEQCWIVLAPLDQHKSEQHIVYSLSEEEMDLIADKKVYCQQLQSAVEVILGEFKQAKSADQKAYAGNELANRRIGQLIRFQLCATIAVIVDDGRRPYRYHGLVEVSLWDSVYQLNDSGSKLFLVYERAKKHACDVNEHPVIANHSMKFRTFISLLLRDGLLAEWIEKLPLLEEPLKKDYIPKSFLRSAAPGCVASLCYKDVSLALEPLMRLPFSVDIFYEFKKPSNSPEDSSGASVIPRESVTSALASTPITASDMLPTVSEDVNADFEIDTGGVKPTVNSQATVSAVEGTSKSEKPGWFKGLNLSMPPMLLRGSSPSPASPKQQKSPSGSTTPTSEAVYEDEEATILKPTFKQKFVGSKWFQQLNIGGALSGPPLRVNVFQKGTAVEVPPQDIAAGALGTELQDNTANVRLVALCDNRTGVGSKELDFRQGDILILERELDTEWIICCSESSGSRGLVPTQFVKKC